jgi:hypothetical protein
LQVALQNNARVNAEKERYQDKSDAADATAGNAFRDAESAPIFYVLAFLFLIEAHRSPPLR